MARQHRFWVAMGAFVALGVLEWFTLGAETIRVIRAPNGEPLLDVSVRGVALAVLALFAFRSWIHSRREMLDQQAKNGLAADPGDSERSRSGPQQ